MNFVTRLSTSEDHRGRYHPHPLLLVTECFSFSLVLGGMYLGSHDMSGHPTFENVPTPINVYTVPVTSYFLVLQYGGSFTVAGTDQATRSEYVRSTIHKLQVRLTDGSTGRSPGCHPQLPPGCLQRNIGGANSPLVRLVSDVKHNGNVHIILNH